MGTNGFFVEPYLCYVFSLLFILNKKCIFIYCKEYYNLISTYFTI